MSCDGNCSMASTKHCSALSSSALTTNGTVGICMHPNTNAGKMNDLAGTVYSELKLQPVPVHTKLNPELKTTRKQSA